MRVSAALAMSAAALVLAEDLLFIDSLEYVEYSEATTKLGYSAKVVTEAEWRAMTTADFAKFKAIVISDPYCGGSTAEIQFLDDTKAVWSPAIGGNIVLIGTDPSLHSGSEPGAVTLIDNSVTFAASGDATGLYFALSCYYNSVDSATVDALSEFGTFTVRGNLGCYNNAHIVASSPALATLDDAALSDWSCSVHEAFSGYPTAGVGGFQALAIAKDILGVGSQDFGDGTTGLPYIISRGAIPAGCGDGVYQPKIGEECDHGKSNGAPGDLCDKSCKCLYVFRNSTSTSFSYHSTTSVPTSTTTAEGPCNTIVGIEIIEIIEIVEVCPEGSTVTTIVTTCLSTLQRPIYSTSTPGYPCYVCAFGPPAPTDFMTVTTTSCPSHPEVTPVVTVKKCSACEETTITTDTIPGCTPTETACPGCAPFVPETPHVHSQAPSVTVPAVVTSARPTGVAPANATLSTVTGYPPAGATSTAKVVTAGAPQVEILGAAIAAGVLGLLAVLA
ncbi:hypothetical protein GQ53DRAFT_889812 [Thozetella sp. PMI_491]|nr:hypothetical protein GQ53DRAFT_889812 [Thozetella sp. PMI_491]